MRHINAALLYVLLIVMTAIAGHTQEKPKMKITATDRQQAIDGILAKLVDQYVFPEVAQKMAQSVREKAAKHEYDSIDDGVTFAQTLTADLRSICNDRHLSVGFSEEVLPPGPETPMEPTGEEVEQARRQVQRENYGFARVEILPGNIGYLKLNYFVDPKWMGDTLAATFNYVADTNALIIDLRENHGSMSEQAIPTFCSYLFEKPTHINSIYWRPGNKTNDYYTLESVPGKRYLNKPIYLLTSSGTFSGAEEFAYDLQNLKRATLIGETTGGGANGGGSVRINDHFTVWIPVGRAINPITKTNWEGVGVKPEIAAPATRALYVARLVALENLIASATDPGWKGHLTELLQETKDNPPALKKVAFRLKGHPGAKAVMLAGTFNSWSQSATPMVRKGDSWIAEVEVEPGRYQYKFVVDGGWITDPSNKLAEGNGQYRNSVLVVR